MSVLPISSTRDLGLAPIINAETRAVSRRMASLPSPAVAARVVNFLSRCWRAGSGPLPERFPGQAYEAYVRANHTEAADPATMARIPDFARDAVNVRPPPAEPPSDPPPRRLLNTPLPLGCLLALIRPRV